MKFHYMGKYSGNPDDLPTRDHEPGNVPFKEPSAEKLPIVMNAMSFVITAAMIVPVFVFGMSYLRDFITVHGVLPFMLIFIGVCLFGSILAIFPHEFLHATCFSGDVYMYTNLKQGMCFVVGPELFSKPRFVLMCMLPNLVLGIIPYIIWIIFPNLWYLGIWGAMASGMGAGDYLNAFNALTQMPKGARTYLHGLGSFWVGEEK